jgi:glucose-1-phosphate cytidylyltransferase
MKVVILAGGLGTRLSEETGLRPKPMVEIGDMPILWHIMKIYSSYGFNEFVILLGYKGQYIREFFANYHLKTKEITFDLASNKISKEDELKENWKITLLDTGANTLTGGRIKRAAHLLKEPFLLTYGDGVADVDIHEIIKKHNDSNALCTLTTIQPEGRFGIVNFDNNGQVKEFVEKRREDQQWINGGFFVCDPSVLDLIKDDSTVFEQEPLMKLAEMEKLYVYKHHGFWKCMDTLRDKVELNQLWDSGEAKWKTW